MTKKQRRKELRRLIVAAMTDDGHEGDESRPAQDIIDHLVDFTNFIESAYIHVVMCTGMMVARIEKDHPAMKGSTRTFFDACFRDVEANLHRNIGRAIRDDLLAINPYAEKSHNEKVAEDILRDMECKGNG